MSSLHQALARPRESCGVSWFYLRFKMILPASSGLAVAGEGGDGASSGLRVTIRKIARTRAANILSPNSQI